MLKSAMPVLTVLVSSLVGAGVVTAQEASDPAAMVLTGSDYEQIKELYARYNQGSDFRDADLFLSAFADDAIMTRGGRDIVGMAALRADRDERYAGQTGDNGRRHVNGSVIITPTADGAKARGYYVLLDVTTQPPAMVASGYYDDVFAKTAEGWRIKHRTLHSDGSR